MKKKLIITSVILALVVPAFLIIGYASGGMKLEKAEMEFGWVDVHAISEGGPLMGIQPDIGRQPDRDITAVPDEALLMDLTLRYSLTGLVDSELESILGSIGPILVKATVPSMGQQPVFELTLESLSGRWWSIGEERAWVDLSASIHNQNPYEFVLYGMEYRVEINGVLLAWGETDGPHTFRPGSRDEVGAGIVVDTVPADDLYRAHVRQLMKSAFNIEIRVALGLPQEVREQLQQGTLTVLISEGSQNFVVEIGAGGEQE